MCPDLGHICKNLCQQYEPGLFCPNLGQKKAGIAENFGKFALMFSFRYNIVRPRQIQDHGGISNED